MSKNNIFIETVRMETQTVFAENGAVSIYPCPWELGQHITMAQTASQPGKMVTEHDGTSHFVPYGHKAGGRYRMVYRSRHCTAKQTLNEWVITFRFPVVMRVRELYVLLREEAKALFGTLQVQDTVKAGTQARGAVLAVEDQSKRRCV